MGSILSRRDEWEAEEDPKQDNKDTIEELQKEVEKWRSIAADLHNAIQHSGDNSEAREAIKRFNDNW